MIRGELGQRTSLGEGHGGGGSRLGVGTLTSRRGSRWGRSEEAEMMG